MFLSKVKENVQLKFLDLSTDPQFFFFFFSYTYESINFFKNLPIILVLFFVFFFNFFFSLSLSNYLEFFFFVRI